MSMFLFRNRAGQAVPLFVLDVSNPESVKGLANQEGNLGTSRFVPKDDDGGVIASAQVGGTFEAMDNTNMPGAYWYFPTQAETDHDRLYFRWICSTANSHVDDDAFSTINKSNLKAINDSKSAATNLQTASDTMLEVTVQPTPAPTTTAVTISSNVGDDRFNGRVLAFPIGTDLEHEAKKIDSVTDGGVGRKILNFAPEDAFTAAPTIGDSAVIY